MFNFVYAQIDLDYITRYPSLHCLINCDINKNPELCEIFKYSIVNVNVANYYDAKDYEITPEVESEAGNMMCKKIFGPNAQYIKNDSSTKGTNSN